MKNFCLSLIFIFLISSCQDPPERPERDFSLPESFSHQPLKSHSLSEHPWWQDFGDPELNHLIEQMMAKNFEIHALEARLRQTFELAQIEGAALTPDVNFTLTQGRERMASQRTILGPTGINFKPDRDTRTTKGWSLSAAWEIDLWGKLKNAQEASQQIYEATAEDLKDFQLSLAAQAAEFYYDLIATRQQLDNLNQRLALAQKNFQQNLERWHQGQISQSVVDEIKNSLESLKAQKPLLYQTEKQTLVNLENLLGHQDLPLISSRQLPKVEATFHMGIPADLLLYRPDLKSFHRQLQAADATIAQAIADRLPALSLTGQYGGSRDKFHETLRADKMFWNLFANLTTPLIDGGRRKALVRLREAERDEILAQYQQRLLQALGEVEASLDRLHQQKQRFSFLYEQERSLQSISSRETLRWQQGLSSYVDKIGHEQNLLTHQEQMILSQREQLSAYIQLARSLGGPWLYPVPEKDSQ